ncbi:MAG TPA: hypothetical protein K8W08_08430 [Empedobacter falsenii]|nr:hypothetical protein [Empedobacter falsenii]
MKRVLLVVLIALGLQSCTIKEEYVIYEDGKIDYNYSLNGNDLKSYIQDEGGYNSLLNEKKEVVENLKKGLTIESLHKIMIEDEDFLNDKRSNAIAYFEENKLLYEKFKQHKVYIDFNELTYSTELNSVSTVISKESDELNTFLFNLFIAIDNPFNTNYLNNQKNINSTSTEIVFNKEDFKTLVSGLMPNFDAGMGDNMVYNNMFNYQLIIHAPTKIVSSTVEDANFSLDQKTIRLNFTFNDIISGKNKSAKITY